MQTWGKDEFVVILIEFDCWCSFHVVRFHLTSYVLRESRVRKSGKRNKCITLLVRHHVEGLSSPADKKPARPFTLMHQRVDDVYGCESSYDTFERCARYSRQQAQASCTWVKAARCWARCTRVDKTRKHAKHALSSNITSCSIYTPIFS